MQTAMAQPLAMRPCTARSTIQGVKPRTFRATHVARAGKADKMGDGVLPGIPSWPPKPITEHGQPKPEDDPANFEGDDITNLKRVAGPSDEEVEAKKEEGRKNSPFSTGREGGTQAGGGGEGSAS